MPADEAVDEDLLSAAAHGVKRVEATAEEPVFRRKEELLLPEEVYVEDVLRERGISLLAWRGKSEIARPWWG
jgi:hypothetical protein